MSHTTNDSEDVLSPKDEIGSPLDESSGGKAGGVVLKKGPWTAAEDAILADYVKKHGEGNWNAVQKHSGLSRCGKSCRLRWANHLRPNLKKGAFTPEEEQLIIELHAKMGNKWARMAAHLPGRTDNEIKNYWNTRIKRRQRAGLPLYPPEVNVKALQACQQGQDTGGINCGDEGPFGFWQTSQFDMMPTDIFPSFNANQDVLPYVPGLTDICSSTFLMKGLGSSQLSSYMPSIMHRQKRLRESTPLFPGPKCSGNTTFNQYQDDSRDKVAGSPFSLDPDPATYNTASFNMIQGSHTLSNGNSSASMPSTRAEKLELPSLQYEKSDLGSWATSPFPPIIEPADPFSQFSPSTGLLGSHCPSECNSGLLDALLHPANSRSSAKNYTSDKSSTTVTPGIAADISKLNVCEEWKEHAQPISPFCHSASSIFTEPTPISSRGSSSNELPRLETFSGSNVKIEADDQVQTPDRENKIKTEINSMRPDVLPASDWLEQNSINEQAFMNDAIEMFLNDDWAADYKSTTPGSPTSDSEWELGSCAWNNLPPVCQMPDRPQ